MKTSVKLTGKFSTGIIQVMTEESIANWDNSYFNDNESFIYETTFFFRTACEAKKALEKAAISMGKFKNEAYFLPNVNYKWMKITKSDIESDTFLKEIYSR